MVNSRCERVNAEYDGIDASVLLVIMVNHAIELLIIVLDTKYSTLNGELAKLEIYAN